MSLMTFNFHIFNEALLKHQRLLIQRSKIYIRLLTILGALHAVLLFRRLSNIPGQRFVRCICIEVLINGSISMNEHLLFWLFLFSVIVIFDKDHLLIAYFMIFNISCICTSIHSQLFLACHFGHRGIALSSIFGNLVDISVGKLFVSDCKTLVKILLLPLPSRVLNNSWCIIIATMMETCEVYLRLLRIIWVQTRPMSLEAPLIVVRWYRISLFYQTISEYQTVFVFVRV